MKLPYEITAPLIVVCGHFGSGKTNVSVALALALKKAGKDVTLIDLDIINPYFRAADAEALMKANGIRCIVEDHTMSAITSTYLGLGGDVRILVAPSDVEEAMRLIEHKD